LNIRLFCTKAPCNFFIFQGQQQSGGSGGGGEKKDDKVCNHLIAYYVDLPNGDKRTLCCSF